MSLSYGDTTYSLDNRRRYLDGLGVDYRKLICAKQVHGNSIYEAGPSDVGRGAVSYESAIDNTDAIITGLRGIPLAVFTADCLSVFLYDPGNKAIGIIHAGWKGTSQNIARETIRKMQHIFGSVPQEIYAGLGPSIKSCCYEVGEEFSGIFKSGVINRNGRFYLNLVELNTRQLLEAGLEPGNICDSGSCTSCSNEVFFSYRREGKACGRMMSVIMVK